MPRTPLLVVALAVSTVAAGCGGDTPERSEGVYCTVVGDHLDALNHPVLATAGDITAVISTWRDVSAHAPLAVQAEWEVLVNSLATAETVDPADPASVQKVADTARAAEPAATRVVDYTQRLCGALIGGVAPAGTAAVVATSTTAG